MHEALHQAALAPLAVLLVLHDRQLLARYGLVAVAFSLSWFGDSLATLFGGSWNAAYLWVPLQIGFVLFGLVKEKVYREFIPWAIALTACTSLALSYPGPEVFVIVTGSVAIMALAWGKLSVPLYIYFGLGTVCYLGMVTQLNGHFMPMWYGYQTCRLAAYVAFAWIVTAERRNHAHPAL